MAVRDMTQIVCRTFIEDLEMPQAETILVRLKMPSGSR